MLSSDILFSMYVETIASLKFRLTTGRLEATCDVRTILVSVLTKLRMVKTTTPAWLMPILVSSVVLRPLLTVTAPCLQAAQPSS